MTTGIILPPVRKRRSPARTVLIIVAICAAAISLLGFIVFRSLSNSEALRMGMEKLESSNQAVALLGAPIKRGWFVQGSINVSGSSGTANLAIPVSGTQRSGKLYVVAEKRLGQWNLTAEELEVEGQSQRLILVQPEATGR